MGSEQLEIPDAQDHSPLGGQPQATLGKIIFPDFQSFPEIAVFYSMKGTFSTTTCILCGAPAERSPHGAYGWAYKCSGRCPYYCIPGTLHYLLEFEILFSRELRLKNSDHLIGLRLEADVCHELSKEDINLATGDRIW